jgi:hypothetical protein
MTIGLGFATDVFLTSQVIDATECRRQKSFSIAYWAILTCSSLVLGLVLHGGQRHLRFA